MRKSSKRTPPNIEILASKESKILFRPWAVGRNGHQDPKVCKVAQPGLFWTFLTSTCWANCATKMWLLVCTLTRAHWNLSQWSMSWKTRSMKCVGKELVWPTKIKLFIDLPIMRCCFFHATLPSCLPVSRTIGHLPSSSSSLMKKIGRL